MTLVVTLGIVAWQTKHLGVQAKQLGKQIEQNTSISTSQYYQNVNVQLLQHPEEANLLLGESKEDAMASIIVGVLQLSFDLEKEQIIYNTSSKKYFEANAVYALRQEPMLQHWKHNKHMYKPNFVQHIDRILQERDREKLNQISTPQSQ